MEKENQKSENMGATGDVHSIDISVSVEKDDNNIKNNEGATELVDKDSNNAVQNVENNEESIEDKDYDTDKITADGDNNFKSLIETDEEKTTEDAKKDVVEDAKKDVVDDAKTHVVDDAKHESDESVERDEDMKETTGIENVPIKVSKKESTYEIHTEATGSDQKVVDKNVAKVSVEGDEKQVSDNLNDIIEIAVVRTTEEAKKDIIDEDKKECGQSILKDVDMKEATGIEKVSIEVSKHVALYEIATGSDQRLVDNDHIKKAAEDAIKKVAEDAIKVVEDVIQKEAEEAIQKVAEEAIQKASKDAIKVAEDVIQKVAEEAILKVAEVQKVAEEAIQKVSEDAIKKAATSSEEASAEDYKMAAHHEINVIVEYSNQEDTEEVTSGIVAELDVISTSSQVSVKRYSPGMAHPHYVRGVPEQPTEQMEEDVDATGGRVIPELRRSPRGFRPIVVSEETAMKETTEQAERRRERNDTYAIPYHRRSALRSYCYNKDLCFSNVCIWLSVATMAFILVFLSSVFFNLSVGSAKSPVVVFPQSIIPESSVISTVVEEISHLQTSYIWPSKSQPYDFHTSDEI